MTATPRPYREVPNCQVVDAASQFHDGYRALAQLPPMSGVLLPRLHCAFISLELYLKSLTAQEVEVPDTVLGFGYYIYAKSPAHSHKLEDLFDLADPIDQQAIDRAVAAMSLLSKFANARAALGAHNSIFMSSRYPFEPQRTLNGIELGALSQLLDAVGDAITKMPPRHVQSTP